MPTIEGLQKRGRYAFYSHYNRRRRRKIKNHAALQDLAICSVLCRIAHGGSCGGSSSANCTVTALNVTPSTATVDHTAAAPGNTQQFAASNLFTGNGVCTVNASAPVTSNWTVSDPSVHLSAPQGTTVTATCTAAAANPVNIRATAVNDASLTGEASLTCR